MIVIISAAVIAVIFSAIIIGMWYYEEDITHPYGEIFKIKNINTAGKIVLCVLITPFSTLPTVLYLLLYGFIYAFYYTIYGFRWIFAEDREQLHKEFFD